MVGLPKTAKWQECRFEGMSSLPIAPATLWNDPCGLMAAPPTRKAGTLAVLFPAVSSTTSKCQEPSSHSANACWLSRGMDAVAPEDPSVLTVPNSVNLSKPCWNPFMFLCIIQWISETGSAENLLSSWGERGRQEGLPGEHLRVLIHTPVSSAACRAWARTWSRSCPPCAVFSALISSSSRKLKSSSGATLKRTTLWPILSGLQISQACERANQPCTLAPLRNSHRVKKKDFAPNPSSAQPYLPRDRCNNSYGHGELFCSLYSPLCRDTQAEGAQNTKAN